MAEEPITGDFIRKRFALRLMVAAKDARLGDPGLRTDGVQSCAALVEQAAVALDRERVLHKEADEGLELAWTELNRATEELDVERARREAAEARALAAEMALVSLTPDGSEFYRRNPDRTAEREFIVDVQACIAFIRDAREKQRVGLVEANRARAEAVDELKSARFRHEQATRCACCRERKHTPLWVDGMGGYVCLTCIDKRLGELLREDQARTGAVEVERARHAADAEALRAVIQHLRPGAAIVRIDEPTTGRHRYELFTNLSAQPTEHVAFLANVRGVPWTEEPKRTPDADLPATGSFHG